MNQSLFNIPKIEKNIKAKHAEFMNNFGAIADKVEADHQLAVEKISAKVMGILTCLSENKVIDNIIVENSGIYKKVVISKKGFNNHIAIWVDEQDIILQKTNIFKSSNILSENDYTAETIYDVDSDKFDWVSFADTLLDYIHNEIYSRKNVAKTRLKAIFSK